MFQGPNIKRSQKRFRLSLVCRLHCGISGRARQAHRQQTHRHHIAGGCHRRFDNRDEPDDFAVELTPTTRH
jgi:hypothetical protein